MPEAFTTPEVVHLDQAYFVLSTATKPTNPSLFLLYEVDTHVWYNWNGTTWVVHLGPGSVSGAASVAIGPSGDGVAAAAAIGPYSNAIMTAFNGSTLDRWRDNTEATLLASAIRAVTTNTPDQTNYNGKGVVLTINVTVEAAAETLSLKLQGKDPVSGNYYDIVDFGTVYTAVSDAPPVTRSFFAHPGNLAADFIGISANGSIGKNVTLPRTWRAVVTHSSTGNWTYSLGGATLL